MNPEDAVLAHQDLGGPHSMAIHFGTFRLSDEGYEDPVAHLFESKRRVALKTDDSGLCKSEKLGKCLSFRG